MKRILLIFIVSLVLQIPAALACKVMGEPSKRETTADQICRDACSFFGGWSGKADDHLKNSAFPYVDCQCDKEPKDGLCQ